MTLEELDLMKAGIEKWPVTRREVRVFIIDALRWFRQRECEIDSLRAENARLRAEQGKAS